jgi:hypothetical protein
VAAVDWSGSYFVTAPDLESLWFGDLGYCSEPTSEAGSFAGSGLGKSLRFLASTGRSLSIVNRS